MNHRLARSLIAGLCTGLAAGAGAQPAAPGPLPDPWVPPAARQPSPTGTRGAALAAQAERKLRAQFEAAGAAGAARLSRDQARAAGLGFVAEHFDAIDAAGRGSVSFDDYKAYLKRRGAAL